MDAYVRPITSLLSLVVSCHPLCYLSLLLTFAYGIRYLMDILYLIWHRSLGHLPVLWHLAWGFSAVEEVLERGAIGHLLLLVKAVLVIQCLDFMIAVKATRYFVLKSCIFPQQF